ncbi:Alternative oxidase, mitochondrial [Cyberlindnera fabianii]|nr:Alternative oxidase, mitochondrial [Cyberlindnera fabianii]
MIANSLLKSTVKSSVRIQLLNAKPSVLGTSIFQRLASTSSSSSSTSSAPSSSPSSSPSPSLYPPSGQHKSPFDISTKLICHPTPTDTEFVTHAMFPHPPMETSDCEKVHFEHRDPVTFGDKVADRGTKFCRACFDFVTGYKKPTDVNGELQTWKGTRYEMTEEKWLTRCIFLESIAGVPGMVAAFLRHLKSLRLLKRDKAWIETLLDEAYNERMHLLTFMKLGNPSWFTRFIIYVGQGVFCNLFFLVYLMRPKYCHRFVGYLEEEAVSTYTHLLKDIDAHRLPRFDKVEIPEIAWQYWGDLNEKSSFRDLILRIRADESKHREVNHTLANLNFKEDRNPFAFKQEGLPEDKQPDAHELKNAKGTGWERTELNL